MEEENRDQPRGHSSRQYNLLVFVNVVAFCFNVVITFLPSGVIGKSNEEVSNQYETIITPAGWAFGPIWAIIFILEAAFVIWQCLPTARGNPWILGIGFWFAAACILQGCWGIAFAAEKIVASAVLLLGIAASLAFACSELTKLRKSAEAPELSWGRYVVVWLPLGLHGGWTLAAGLVNVSLAVYVEGASAQAQLVVAAVSLGIAAVGGLVASRQMHAAYSLAVAWGLLAIGLNQATTRERLGEDTAQALEYTSVALAIVLALAALFKPHPCGPAKADIDNRTLLTQAIPR
uniref:Tryptophan-rich sensory protein n=1 Tax=Fibrocapsa japonica TaxID=94617 RepID=A0A7S2V2F8_9STRA|mmetsp:Transcript_4200/g.6263  ORF Transcript_4200/g.6263 Transcript_4200/m.6263 type:complete len:291 (+) Transcript_4200:147-1019(+)|eukprot:CAMPEP_0113935886 /NCGR_PEP_ID=MMETSP1339-20121228/2924_1 /TAXON_ID=94617 /ORGANISM="Fibrocapsa japonica" /LENGTH=290 /DNA_ID=CAMNT_0000938177 /DNA_START=154 /DNA_END=1026 /DNA_ORIENTATION=- /assembly_acc=CAM_ASM_000762